MIEYLERVFAFSVLGKVFCVTGGGKPALVPPLAKVGDTLVHVRGGFLPVVLRRKEGEGRRAVLVGTCEVLHEKRVYSGAGWEDWLLE